MKLLIKEMTVDNDTKFSKPSDEHAAHDLSELRECCAVN